MATEQVIADISTTGVPEVVVNPHRSNAFAVDDGVATEDHSWPKRASVDVENAGERSASVVQRELYPPPTEEELVTLRKVPGSIPTVAWLLCAVELAERASYYGASTVFSNFLQFPLPAGGNGAGAPPPGTQGTAGALGYGLQFANAFVLLFQFLSYIIPIGGGWVADTKLGKFKTILIGVFICGIAHIIMICGAIPSLLQAGRGAAPFIVSLLLLAIGAGIFKPSVAPMIMDQYRHQKPYILVLPKTGERVVVDPESTIQRIILIFYAIINVGAFFAIATTYCEKYVGYWLAFLLPGIVYFALPFLLWYLNNKLVKYPPDGTVLVKALKIFVLAVAKSKGKLWSTTFLDAAKPSVLATKSTTTFRGKPIDWTDKDVEDVKRTATACLIFLYLPIWYINDGGVGTVATSQAATMTTNGAPNDLLGNFNPLTIIVTVPLLSYVIYPTLRRYKIKFGRISRITFGFVLTIISGIIGTIVQWQVYETSPCGYYATTCDDVSPLNVWIQIPNISLGAISECFCVVTAYELAYARSPPGMKSLVVALSLASLSLSYALGEILSPVIQDPYLIWVWAGPTIALAAQTVIFWIRYRKYNDDEFMTEESVTHGKVKEPVSVTRGSDVSSSVEKEAVV